MKKTQKKNKTHTHIPIRTCIFCRDRFEKHTLLRFVRKDKVIYFDKRYRLEGRGFYICQKEECLRKALDKKTFEKRLHYKLSDNNFDKLQNTIKAIYHDKFAESEEVHCEKK